MADVSAAVVTLNEEENIRDCLETLEWCDEIIIVDSFSDDDTVEIAKEYTDEIYTFERTGYGDPAREKALKEASNEWICMVDADELVPKALADKLCDEVQKDEYDVIYAPRMNFSLGKWIDGAGWWPDYRPVLYRRGVVTYSNSPHDFISFSNSGNEKKLGVHKRYAIRHFNHIDIEDKISRMNKYTSIEADQTRFSYSKLLLEPTTEFVERFILQKGYRLGWYGFLLSSFQAWYKFMLLAKSRENEQMGGKEGILNEYRTRREEVLDEWNV